MKIVKKILLVLLILIAIPLVIAIFVKKDFFIEKQIVVNKPKADVFGYIKNLKNQNDYSVWAKLDPNMKKTYTGTDATPGFVSAWEGNSDVGKGEQEIASIVEGERMDTKLRFHTPFGIMENKSYMITEDAGNNTTRIKWAFAGHTAYPLNFMNLFMEKSVGKDLQAGLDNLKPILEK